MCGNVCMRGPGSQAAPGGCGEPDYCPLGSTLLFCRGHRIFSRTYISQPALQLGVVTASGRWDAARFWRLLRIIPRRLLGTHTHFFGLCSELVCVTGGPSWYVMKELGPDTSWIRGTYWLGLLTAGFLHERNKLGSCLSHCHFRSVIRTKSNPNEHSRDLFVCLLAATSHSSARTSSLLFLRLWWTVSHQVPPFSPTGWAGSQTIPARIPSPCAREGNLSGVAPSGRWV